MNTETATTPSAREVRNAVRDLSDAQRKILAEVERSGATVRSLSRPTRDALVRKGIVERSATGTLTLTGLGEAVARQIVYPGMSFGVSEPAALCDGGSAACEGLVTDPEHVPAARTGDLSNFPYCAPCRVAAHADDVTDNPVQGPRPATSSIPRATARTLATEYRERNRRTHAAAGMAEHDRALERLTEAHAEVRSWDSTLSTWLLCERCDFTALAHAVHVPELTPDELERLAADWRESWTRTEAYIQSLED